MADLNTLRYMRNEFIKKRKWQEALDVVNKMIVLQPNRPSLYARRAMILANIEGIDPAISAIEKVVEKYPEYTRAQAILAKLCKLKNGENKSVEKLFEEIELMSSSDSTPLLHPSKIIKPGDVFAERYEIKERLGRGGMGVVYKALDRILQKPVALKLILNVNDDNIQRFRQEMRALKQMEHPHIIKFYDAGDIIKFYNMWMLHLL